MTQTLKLTSLLGNSQKLDGGAMFGNAPKAMWSRWITPDQLNRIPLQCRCLLLQTPEQNILLETGIGHFFPPQYKKRYGVNEDRHCLLDNLKALDLTPQDIHVIILSHLHFDHVGGILSSYSDHKPLEIIFPKSQIFVGRQAYQRFLTPHSRDRASFIDQLRPLLEGHPQLYFLEGPTHPLLPSFLHFHYSQGHTPGLVLTEIRGQEYSVFYCADLIPGAPWVHLPITMGYDRYPEKLIEEKKEIIALAESKKHFLFFTHDPSIAMAQVKLNEKGKYSTTNPQEFLADHPLEVSDA